MFNNIVSETLKEDKFKKLNLFADKKDVEISIKAFAKNIFATCEDRGINKINLVPILTGGNFLSKRLKKYIKKLSLNKNLIINVNPIKISTYNDETMSNEDNIVNINLMNNNLVLSTNELTILIDDILDSGNTIKIARNLYKQKNEINTFNNNFISLVRLSKSFDEFINNKETNHLCIFEVDLFLKDTTDIWFVGCGLDLGDKYRYKKEIRFINKYDFFKNKNNYI